MKWHVGDVLRWDNAVYGQSGPYLFTILSIKEQTDPIYYGVLSDLNGSQIGAPDYVLQSFLIANGAFLQTAKQSSNSWLLALGIVAIGFLLFHKK